MQNHEYFGTQQAHSHHRRAEWRRQNDLCPRVPADGCGVAELHERRPDCRRTVAFRARSGRVQGGCLTLETIADYAKRGESFSFEAKLAGLTYAQMSPAWPRTLKQTGLALTH